MAYLVAIPLLAFLAILQSTVFSSFGLLDGRPDLVFLAVVAWGISGHARQAMVWGLIGGLLLDLFSGVPFGSSAIVLILVAFLVSLFEGRLWEAHLLMPLWITLAASFIYHFLGIGILVLAGRSIDFVVALNRVILPSAFLNLLLALPASQMAAALRDSLFPPEVSI